MNILIRPEPKKNLLYSLKVKMNSQKLNIEAKKNLNCNDSKSIEQLESIGKIIIDIKRDDENRNHYDIKCMRNDLIQNNPIDFIFEKKLSADSHKIKPMKIINENVRESQMRTKAKTFLKSKLSKKLEHLRPDNSIFKNKKISAGGKFKLEYKNKPLGKSERLRSSPHFKQAHPNICKETVFDKDPKIRQKECKKYLNSE
jgi:hypothetical protein